MGFQQSAHEAAVYRRGSGRSVLLIGVYVDDLIITGAEGDRVEAFKAQKKKEFDMSDLGLFCFYLGVEVRQDVSGIALCQTHYAKRILELDGMTGYNPAHTSMEERLKLSRDSMTEEVDSTHYRRLIGSLRYLVHTRQDLAFAIGYVNRIMERPTMEHLQAVKRILRYVAGALDYGLHYGKAPNTASFVGYYDSYLTGDVAPARAQPGLCSSSVDAWSAGSLSSRRWWPSQAVKQSTSPPPLQQLRYYGCQGCWQSSLAGM
ncbi:uncharacterized mitochondrial protein AtMg00810-like [Miscanthus floridulus]|uniref:uncharacterized mitochondrial protein AtMg00810-like n=1 Tax=Miscanthus floridulus TaxID=154761 RepID=UPI003458C510